MFKGVISEDIYCFSDRYREQARSHKGSAVDTGFVHTAIHCGSEPARDGGGEDTATISSDHTFL
ncbi:protein of unknown function [Pseudomonas mediterranea]